MALLAKVKNWFHAFNPQTLRSIRDSELPSENGISYRFAEQEDIADLLAVERDVFTEVPWTYSNFKFEISDNKWALFMLAERSDEILGYLGMRWSWEFAELHISNFVVKKSAQGQGIGSQLLQNTEKIAQQLQTSKLSLEVRRDNLNAQAFYRKRAFVSKETMKDYYSDGGDAIIMIKDLPLLPTEN